MALRPGAAAAALVLLALLAWAVVAEARIRYCHRPLNKPPSRRVSRVLVNDPCRATLLSEMETGTKTDLDSNSFEAFVTLARCFPRVGPVASQVDVTIKVVGLGSPDRASEFEIALSLGPAGQSGRFEWAVVPVVVLKEMSTAGFNAETKVRDGKFELELVAGPRVSEQGLGYESEPYLRWGTPVGRGGDQVAFAAKAESKSERIDDPKLEAGAEVTFGRAGMRLITDVLTPVDSVAAKIGLSVVYSF